MKNFISILFLFLNIVPSWSNAQNIPDGSTTTPGTSVVEAPPANLSGVTLFNYTRTWHPQQWMTDESLLNETSPNEQIRMTTTYTDGMGKEMQIVHKSNSTIGYDLVQPMDNRPSSTSLNFLPYPKLFGGGKFQPSAFSEQRSYYLGIYPNEDATAYSKRTYNNWTTKEYTPGKATAGQSRGSESYNEIMTGSFPKYEMNYSSYLPVSYGDYSPNELIQKVTTNADGASIREFIDKEGKKIAQVVLLDPLTSNNLITFYIYDNYGREVFIITPKAYELSSGTITSSIAESLCYYAKYDERGRIYEKHIPGESGNENIVYDQKGRSILVQTPLLRSKGQWIYTLYDKLDRVTHTGLLASLSSRIYFQNILDGVTPLLLVTPPAGVKPTGIFYYLFENYEGVYPDALDDCYMLTFNYYDNYTYATSLGRSATSGSTTTYLSPSSFDIVNFVRNKLTAKKIRILKPTGSSLPDWITELYFYDAYGNIVHTQRKNMYGAWDSQYDQYDFKGKLLMHVLDHNNPACSTKAHTTVATKYTYYPYSQDIYKIEQETDLGGWQPIAAHTYNLTNQLINKNIGGIENQAYSYDIRGRLTGINKAYAEEDPYSPSLSNFFGESLSYETGFTNKLYCGSISGMIWRNSGAAKLMAYGYDYDKAGRLTKADFRMLEEDWSMGFLLYMMNNAKTDYSVPSISYDNNGNILSMKQMGVPVGGSSPVVIDDLIYTYENSGASNRINSVYDAVSSGLNTSYRLNDYINNSGGPNDFDYDENGNLKKHIDKNITSIAYNFIDLPETIDFATGNSIKYVYDAEGNKLRQQVSDGSTITNYEFCGPFVYKDNALLYSIHTEGVSRYHEKSPSVWGWDYDFFIKDHLGNVRATATSEYKGMLTYEAGFELADAATEANFFVALNPLRDPRPTSSSPSDLMAARLTSSDANRRVGASLMLKVMAGDQFELSADNYYETPYNSVADQTISGESLFNSVVSTLVGSGGIIGGPEGTPSTGIIGQMFSPDNYLGIYQPIINAGTDPSRPKAYINYMVFDENMKLVASESGVIQANTLSGNWQVIGTSGPITIHTNGYLVAYLSSASSISVSFDHFKLHHYKGKLLEETNYYPYGLAINAGSMNPLEKKYLYQSKELQSELGLMWQDFHARQYDPQMGRFNSIDPKGQFSSGYTAMGNNPIATIDPDGQFAHIVVGFIVGGLINVAVHSGQIHNWQDAAVAFGIGGTAGAVAAATGGASLAATGAVASVTSIAAAGAGSAAFGYMASQPILDIGNHLYFHDPLSTPEQFAKGMVLSAGSGYLLSGTLARMEGLPWKISPKPIPTGERIIQYRSSPNASTETQNAQIATFTESSPVPLNDVIINSARKEASSYSEDLVKAAQKLYPRKAGKIELHHITPKYLGGPANGPLVPLDASYHQVITNEFRALWPYGKGVPSATEVQNIMQQVYTKYPLP